jgi:hypothetical protein
MPAMLGSWPGVVSNARCALLALSIAALLAGCAEKHGERGSVAPGPDASAGSSGKAGRAGAGGARSIERGEKNRLGARATASLDPIGNATEDGSWRSGTATFMQTAAGVDLMLQMRGCLTDHTYPLFIQEGRDCNAETLLGAHWDSPRGENMSEVKCVGTTGGGRTFYTRAVSDKKAWTIGEPTNSNILGHVLVAFDSTTSQPVACGQIVRAEDSPVVTPPSDAEPAPSAETKAYLAGYCLSTQIVRDNAQQCPDPAALAKCASEHCELDACAQKCSKYLACTQQDPVPCENCVPEDDCGQCSSDVYQCTIGFCFDQFACAAPVSPDGPCSQLEACCAQQGDQAGECLELVQLIEKISGDPSCFGALRDWDTFAHLQVPCKFE